MKGLGFGLERIGILALRSPVLFSVILITITAICAFNILNVKFNGSVLGVVPKTSENFINYNQQKEDFRDFSRDVAVIIRSPRINEASGLEDLRFMQLELAITDGIATAVSLFSIPDPDRQTGELKQFFPNQIENNEEASRLLDRLVNDYPQASSLISRDDNMVLLLVGLDLESANGNDERAFEAFKNLKKAVESVAPADFEVFYSGLTPIGLSIIETLLTDQVKLTIVGLLIGALIATLFFRSLAAAIVCSVPPMLTAIWAIGSFGLLNVPITYLTTILPTLALILAYADGIVLYHRWNKLNTTVEHNNDISVLRANLKEAVLRVGPASALTSLTTAFAIASFSLSSSEALVEFAWVGLILILYAFVAVVVGVPVLGIWLLKLGLIKPKKRVEAGDGFGKAINGIYTKAPKTITIASLISVLGMFYVHFALAPNYTITDYLPRGSATLEAEEISNNVFGGRSLIFFTVPTVYDKGMASPQNRERLAEVTQLLKNDFSGSRVFSLHSLWADYNEAVISKIASQLDNAPEYTRGGYLSKDGSKMLVSLRTPSDQSIAETAVLVDEIRQSLGKLSYSQDIVITGFPVILSSEFTNIINELRTSLLVAVAVGIILIGLATRSWFFAMVAAVPNLFPVLVTELIIYLRGGNINVTEVVALTIAFGIAIDNAVHVINVYNHERESGRDVQTALRNAIVEVAPALGASTLIICASTASVLLSVLPILSIIGELLIAILVIALVTNLIILPANILTLARVFSSEKSK